MDQSSKLPALNLRLAESSEAGQAGTLKPLWSSVQLRKSGSDLFRVFVLAAVAFALFAICGAIYAVLNALGLFKPAAISELNDPRRLHQYHENSLLSAHYDALQENLWLGTGNGAEVYNRRTRLWQSIVPGMASFPVRWVTQSGEDIFLGDGAGTVHRWLNGRLTPMFGVTDLRNLDLSKVVDVSVGRHEILIAQSRSLIIYDRRNRHFTRFVHNPNNGKWREVFGPSDETDLVSITSLAFAENEDAHYIGTGSGLFIWRRGKWRTPEPEQPDKSPVLKLDYNAGVIWYVRGGAQGSLRVGSIIDKKSRDFMTPGKLNVPPADTRDITRWQNFLFMGTKNQFLRVCNIADRSWESVSFNQTSDAPEIRQLEVHGEKLWLATDRGLLVFADPERLWEIGRSAGVPVFRAIYGYLEKTTETGLIREDAGVRKMFKTPRHLWFVTDKSTLARIRFADEKVEWLIQDSRALVQAEAASKGLGYQIKPTDLLSAHSSEEGLLVGTRRGVFRYDMAEHLWSRWEQETFGERQIYDMCDASGGGLAILTDQKIHNGTNTLDHPPDDRALRLYRGKERTLYSTAKGSLGQLSGRTRSPLISSSPAVEDLKFTSAAQTPTHLYLATDGKGIQVYNSLMRRWEKSLTTSPDGLPSDSILEVRAGRSFLASRSAQGGITLRLGNRWVPLIGEGKLEIEDKDITAMAANGEHLWLAGRDLIAAYHIRTRTWSKPISLKTKGHVQTLYVTEGRSLALTSEGELFKGEILLKKNVSSLAAYGKTIVFLRGNELNLRSQWGEDTRPATGLPEDAELRDVAETRRFFLAATANNLYAYDKDARTWQAWGSPPSGKIRELATKDGEVLAQTETDTFRCAPRGLWLKAGDAKLKPRGTIRVDNVFWIWIREGGAIKGAFKSASNTPVFSKSGGQKRFSFDTVSDLKVVGDTIWLLTRAGPLPLPDKPALTSLNKLIIPPTGPVDGLLAVSSQGVGTELKILAIAPGEITWEFAKDRRKWMKTSAYESSNTAPSFAPGHRHTLILNDNWRVESERTGGRTILHKWQRTGERWKPFRLVEGRWSFDNVQSMLAHGNELWLASTDTIKRIEIEEDAKYPSSIETFDWPRVSTASKFRFLHGREKPTFIAVPPAGLNAFEFDRQQKSWKAVALEPAGTFESNVVVKMPSLRWIEDYSKGVQLSAAVKYSDGTESVISLKRPFPFDRFHSVLPGADSVWLSTEIGIAECLVESARLPLNEMRFHRAGKAGGQLLLLEEVSEDLKSGVYYRSPDGSAWQMPHLESGISKVARVKKTVPILKLSGEEDVLHEFDGFWRWVRERDWDHTAEPKKPLVRIEALDSAGNWAEIEFEGGRFAFDKVNDILTSDGAIWLATDGGLCGFEISGSGIGAPTQVRPPKESGAPTTPLDLADATIFPDLSPATELVRDALSNQLFIRLQQKAKSVYSVSLPNGNPQKVTGSANPFRKRPRLTDGRTRWSHLEEYDGNQLDHTHLHLDVRGPRGLWQKVELKRGLLPIDTIRDLKYKDNTLWLATPAGIVAWETTKPPGEQEFRFYSEPGDVWRLLKKDSEESEIMCLSRGARGVETYRFSKAPVEGKHWLRLDKPSLFRARIAQDSHWHWYRELTGISILWRGLQSRQRQILQGRFADEMALAIAMRENKLFAWTPSGIALYAMKKESLELITIYEHPDDAYGSTSEPVAMGFDGAALYVAVGKRLLQIRAEGEGGNYSITKEWQLPLRGRPDRLLIRLTDAGLLLEAAQHSPKPFFQLFRITDTGPGPINKLTVGAQELEIGESVTFGGVSLLSGSAPTAGIIPLPDGYWIAGKQKAVRLR
jgi:ligand-binding sensor domain-containing protein